MARFSSDEDVGFQSIATELQRWTKDIQQSIPVSGPSEPTSPAPGPPDPFAEENCRSFGDIVIWGDVKQSNIVNGHQIVQGGMRFGT